MLQRHWRHFGYPVAVITALLCPSQSQKYGDIQAINDVDDSSMSVMTQAQIDRLSG